MIRPQPFGIVATVFAAYGIDKLLPPPAEDGDELPEPCQHRDDGRGFCIGCGEVIKGGYGG